MTLRVPNVIFFFLLIPAAPLFRYTYKSYLYSYKTTYRGLLKQRVKTTNQGVRCDFFIVNFNVCPGGCPVIIADV